MERQRPEMQLRRILIAAFVFACSAVAVRADDGGPSLPSFAEPGISPDHREIAFVSGGDIWTVPLGGGSARLLVSFGAAESRPLYSPDGTKLAFTSARTGNGDVYVLTLDGGDLKRLTFDDGLDALEGWAPDGKSVYFSSNAKNIASSSDIYRVRVDGGTPMPVVNERYVHQYESAVSPDGTRLAYVAGGFADQQWWRIGHSHMDQSRIAIKSLRTDSYETVTAGGAKELWPMWSPDGRTLYYVSDRSGAPNLWAIVPGAKPHRLTSFTDGRVVWPSISRDGHDIVFERDFGIWSYDIASGATEHVAIERRGLPASATNDHITLTSRLAHLVLSPDGRKVAFVARGQIFAASAKDGGDAQRVTQTHANESLPAWSPDSRRVVYMSDRSGGENLFMYDFASATETQLTVGTNRNAYPLFSPDGRSVAYERDAHDVRIVDIATKADRILAKGFFTPFPDGSGGEMAFSPGGEWLAYTATDTLGFDNVRVVHTSGGASQPISFLANGSAGSIAWAPDATRVFYTTSQRTEAGAVAQVDLIPRAPKFREDAFRDLFEELPSRSVPVPHPTARATSAAARATAAPHTVAQIAFEGIRDRLRLLPSGLDVNDIRIAPDGKTVLLNANAAGQQNLYSYSIDELATSAPVARQITSSPGAKIDEQFAPDGQSVYYLENGRAFIASLDGRTPPHLLPLAAELDVDFSRDKTEMFSQAWTYLDDTYYDPHFHGVNWNAVHAKYEPYVRGARTPAELRRLLNLMVGELDSSHSGVFAPLPPISPLSTGYLGVRYDATTYAQSGRLKISEIIPLGPVDLTRTVHRGDEIVAVDGRAIDAQTNIDELLANTIGKRTILKVASHGDLATARDVAVEPTDRPTEKDLLYRSWVEHNRRYVERASGGRLGYVHLYDMTEPSLEQLSIDLDVQNEGRDGVIVDIRNNNGGFVDPYAIDVFNRHDYIAFTSRVSGAGRTSERRGLGQRALTLPTVLITNEHSLSDAENFAEGYRRLHLGKIVGEPTAGWIIFTGGAQLVDGSLVRLPETGVYGADGVDMELHPRPVDVRVERPLGEADAGRDAQLDAAIRTLQRDVPKHH